MIINHNMASLNTYRQMSINERNTSNSLEKLSSGLRINKAGDDAAGLAISEKMRGQIRGLDQASRNAQDGISLIQTAEGALNETHSILQRMRELADQSSNDTATDSDRTQMQKEVSQLKSEIDRISSTTEFNTKKLLNGSLTTAKTAQGSIDVSNQVKAADTAATAGTAAAGLAMVTSTASAGQTGTAYTYVAAAALADRTIIQAGNNDEFKITINGGTTVTATIAASTTEGYTKDQFVTALNSAVQTAVGATTWGNDFNKAIFSQTSDGHLQIQTKSTGSSATYGITFAVPTTAAETGLAAMGYAAKATTISGTVDLGSAPVALGATAASDLFTVTLGNHSSISIDLVNNAGLAAGQAYTLSEYQTHIQSALDSAMGQGAITVGNDGQHLTLVSNVGTDTFSIAEAANTNGATQLFGGGMAAATITQSANNTIKGTNTVNAVAAGTVITKGANDEFNISVDGGATQTLILNAGNYATKQDLVTEINNQINDNQNLVGKVTAALDNNGKVTFTSNSTGSSSDVVISNPTSVSQSALGAIGYAGAAGGITGSNNLATGIDLTGTGTKMKVTLGNKTVSIDLAGAEGINTDAAAVPPKSSRDAIVKALQSKLDTAFGTGAITVNTSTAPGGADTLSLTTNARASAFSIAEDGGGIVNALFGAATKTANVSAAGTNLRTDGTDVVHNTLANSTLLTSISDSDGNNLGLAAGNVIKISGTQNGSEFNASVTIDASSTMADIMNSMRNLPQFSGSTVNLDSTTGKITVSGADGQTKDITNLQFAAQASATDSTAVANFNRVFGSFQQTQQAQNAASDSSLVMHIGANQGQTMNVDINEMSTQSLRLADVDISSQTGAESAISVINNAIESVSAERAKLGAFQNRLEHTINNLGTSSENLTAAESRVRDVDMAKEMMNFQKNNILQQAGQAMLAQANQQPQGVLQLLR